MRELTIQSVDDVVIKDNIIHISCGFRTNNLIPLASISLITEILRTNSDLRTNSNKTYSLNIVINEQFKIQTETYSESESERYQTIMYDIHNKLMTAIQDYHTNTFRISKPRDLNNTSFTQP
jgi:hypothetical protein